MKTFSEKGEKLLKALTEELAPFAGLRLGLAVSGGSDSRALLELAHAWALRTGSELAVATVDHKLREAAAAEAKQVGAICLAMGIPHEVLVWEGWDRQGNLQAEARRARYRLVDDWASCGGIAAVALGHTADDVAETFLMRLTRSAGVDGLAQMRPRFNRNGTVFVRPMLGMLRRDLQSFLREEGVDWIDDPSNVDTRFDRVKIREGLGQLGAMGLDTKKIAQSSAHLSAASEALSYYAAKEAREIISTADGDVQIDAERLQSLPSEMQRRLITASLAFVAPTDYAPRSRAVENLLPQLGDQAVATLGGCVLTLKGNEIRVMREASAATQIVRDPHDGVEWDQRWRIAGKFPTGSDVRALGEAGILQCPEWRETGRARRALLASPSIWNGDTLVAAPLARTETNFTAIPLRDKEDLLRNILSH
ncbi:tRNA lysidine(34) synthetase TilS [Falsihalocynthiibacter sp. SS001]|uniref:tRNA lysidine(34) synthetase TilS n=1 Tax=Falsihalocynthiibacter sp. SS001 TaxID=3349698 RepID=UPI0036D3F5B5